MISLLEDVELAVGARQVECPVRQRSLVHRARQRMSGILKKRASNILDFALVFCRSGVTVDSPVEK